MGAFVKKILSNNESCGSILKARREAVGISVEEVSVHTGIREHYLESLEADLYHELPGDWYVRKYLSVYAQYVGLSARDVLARYDPPKSSRDALASRALRLRGILPSSRLAVWPRRVTRISLAFGLALFLSLLAVRMAARLSPPTLAVTYPPEGYITHMDTLALSGVSEPEARIAVNGESLVPAGDGSFSLMVHLSYGVNVYTITAQRRFGGSTKVSRRIVKDGIAQSAGPQYDITP